MSTPPPDAVARLEGRVARERTARKEAERLLEEKSLELFRANESLRALAASLEARVVERTAELEEELTERRRVEAALRARDVELSAARDAAEQASRAKSAFLATMSHEIRTPMNGVLGMAELLSASAVDADQAEALRTIRTSGQFLLTLIDDILDFSKIEAGHLELERAPVQLPELVEDSVEAIASVAAAKHVELSTFVDPDVPLVVFGDGVRLRQIVTNLTGNAVKFGAGREGAPGRVRVRLELSPEQPPRLALGVSDAGVGMSAETLARLFTPFTQGEISTTRRFGGSGLGLAITRRLVELMGGEIRVESTVDVGSTFTVFLPIERDATPSPPPPQVLGEVSVLLSASLGLDRDDLGRILEAHGARVHRAPSNAWGMLRARDLPPPVVIVHRAPNVQEPGARAAFAELTHVRHLVLSAAHRGPPRLVGDDAIATDGLRRASLVRAVAVLVGRASPEVAPTPMRSGRAAPATIAPPPPPADPGARPRLLVAEDDAVNRAVVSRQLALLGYDADLACDGREALTMWSQGSYALVLSDLHMPHLDGYSFAHAVRDAERTLGRPRTPVLALTANALKGEANRALAAGFDAFLTKPIPLSTLQEALTAWVPKPAPAEAVARPEAAAGPPAPAAAAPSPPASAEPPDAPVLDTRELEDLFSGDTSTLRALLSDLRRTGNEDVTRTREALARGDDTLVRRTAHRLKSAAASAGAKRLVHIVGALENAPTVTPEAVEAFEAEWRRVSAALEVWRPSLPGG